MSDPENEQNGIAKGGALDKALSGYHVPALSNDFADRVVARSKDRPEPLPSLRKGTSRNRRWSTARRLTVGALAAGALASAAAATGVLGDLPIRLPSPEQIWSSITGDEQESARRPQRLPASDGAEAAEAPETAIEGPIDSSEELEEAFSRIDQARGDRREERRSRVDQRIDETLEQRREQGLPAPTAEQEERLRNRLEQFREKRDATLEERRATTREELRERVENGEELTPRELIREERAGGLRPEARERLEELRELSPEERRERIRQFRERRQERAGQRLRRFTPEERSSIYDDTNDEPINGAAPPIESEQVDQPE